MGKDELTFKQKKFCNEYILSDGNASEAYRRAYNAKKMKIETIHRKAKEVMDNGKVAARIKELQAEIAKKYEVTVDTLTRNLFIAIDQAKMPERRGSKKISDPRLLTDTAMKIARLHGLLNKSDQPIAPTFTRMDQVLIDGVPVDWGVGEKVLK